MRTVLALALIAVSMLSARALAEPPREAIDYGDEEWSFEQVIDIARERAAQRYREPSATAPQALRELDYDRHRAIRYRTERALWADDARFNAQFFHMGFLFDDPVTVHVVDNGEVSRLAFDTELFEYGEIAGDLDERLGDADIGFAGFRLLYPLNDPDKDDELAVFLGASYFRMLGPGHRYGLSARGLAIDTALSSGEEFPAFREFWLEQPDEDASTVTLYALLDSPSVTGAYRFEFGVDDRTEAIVDAHLFARTDVAKTGIAPLTSMYLYSGHTRHAMDDFRPRVHDSDGLLMQTSADEWIWRPLSNPRSLRVSALMDNGPRGFGLVQRERDFDQYLDLEARYERRPSLWVEPLDGDWGAGHVELIEIPTDSETHDNIVAYWVPRERLSAGDSRHFSYRLTAFDAHLERQPTARAVRTRIGWAAVPGASNPPPRSTRRFVVDFAGGALDALPADVEPKAELVGARGEVDDLMVQRLPDDGGWRVSFRLTPDGRNAEDLRLRLVNDGERLTETWTRVWYPDDIAN